MTNRERVLRAITFDRPDVPPCQCSLTGQMRDKLFAYPGGKECYEKFGSPTASVDLIPPQTPVKFEYDRDWFGVVWNKTGADKDIGVIDNLMIPDPEDFENYVFPPVPEEWIRKNCAWLETQKKDKFTVASLGFSLFERAWTLCGMENLLCYMIVEPEFAHALLERITDFNLKCLDIALEYDFDAVYFGDDWGQQHGMIMGPEHWREFIKPCLEKMYGRVKKAGRYVVQHSCGDNQEVLEDLMELGLDVYQTFQPEIYDLRHYQKVFKGRLSIWGGISTQAELPSKTPEEIKALTTERLELFREGGLIAGPTHAVPGDVPPENLIAMLEAMMDFR